MRVSLSQLHLLASLHGINTSYLDMNEKLSRASRDSLFAVLKAMGSPVSTMQDLPGAIRVRKLQYWRRVLEPVIVHRGNDILTIDLHLPAGSTSIPMVGSLELENGEERTMHWRGDETFIVESCSVGSDRFVTMRLYLPEQLPYGYHRLKMSLPGQSAETLIISAPPHAYGPPEKSEKIWGVFLPLYALHSRRSWGAGDYSDMESLMTWTHEIGGRMAGTLPLLASFFDSRFGPTPYTPASRLFWNEFYLDINQVPEFQTCTAAQSLFSSSGFQKEISALRDSHFVDYQRQLYLKRNVLEAMVEYFYNEKPARFNDFQRHIACSEYLEDYARFRAAGEQHGTCWNDWQQKLRNGELKEDDYSEKNKRYHLYTQWLVQQQLEHLSRKAMVNKVLWYMDFPVGVHPFSYDVWRERESFVTGVDGGAPPDPVFTSGQNWNFPPLHPENIRNTGYRYFINSLRCQLKHAGMLRMDHMMNLHRFFWIPQGMENKEGVYVNYRADELYAILALESYRHQSIIIGEDLGMVPPEVRPEMERNGIYRMFVGQYQLIVENKMGTVPDNSVASLNTHDMYPFAAFWEENDIRERRKLKLTGLKSSKKELELRRRMKINLSDILQQRGFRNNITEDTGAALRAILKLLAASPAFSILVNLEDLWLETSPQNVPGTQNERNWNRKTRYSFEEFSSMRSVVGLLQEIGRVRKGENVQQ